MTAEEVRRLVEHDKRIATGQRVKVRWGYGLGFRAEGQGVITKVYAKSVRVRLTKEVRVGFSIGEGTWPVGFELRGIPRFAVLNGSWSEWNCVQPLDPKEEGDA